MSGKEFTKKREGIALDSVKLTKQYRKLLDLLTSLNNSIDGVEGRCYDTEDALLLALRKDAKLPSAELFRKVFQYDMEASEVDNFLENQFPYFVFTNTSHIHMERFPFRVPKLVTTYDGPADDELKEALTMLEAMPSVPTSTIKRGRHSTPCNNYKLLGFVPSGRVLREREAPFVLFLEDGTFQAVNMSGEMAYAAIGKPQPDFPAAMRLVIEWIEKQLNKRNHSLIQARQQELLGDIHFDEDEDINEFDDCVQKASKAGRKPTAKRAGRKPTIEY